MKKLIFLLFVAATFALQGQTEQYYNPSDTTASGGGISSVSTDTTLTGDGSEGNPLAARYFARNGLSILDNHAELGGTLYKFTLVDLDGNDMIWQDNSTVSWLNESFYRMHVNNGFFESDLDLNSGGASLASSVGSAIIGNNNVGADNSNFFKADNDGLLLQLDNNDTWRITGSKINSGLDGKYLQLGNYNLGNNTMEIKFTDGSGAASADPDSTNELQIPTLKLINQNQLLLQLSKNGALSTLTLPSIPYCDSSSIEIISNGTVQASNNKYYAYVGIDKAVNGDWVMGYYNGTNHSTGGTLEVIRSTDEGVNWSNPDTIESNAADNTRNGLIKTLADGRILMTYFQLTTPSVYARVSEDNGLTWGNRILVRENIGTNGSYTEGKVAECGGNILIPFYTDTNAGVAITDQELSTFSYVEFPTVSGKYFNETSFINKNGQIIALIREENADTIYRATSKDCGLTWSTPQIVKGLVDPAAGKPAIYLLPSGAIIMQYRQVLSSDYRGAIVISEDNGLSWHSYVENTDTEDMVYGDWILKSDGKLYLAYGAEKGAFEQFASIEYDIVQVNCPEQATVVSSGNDIPDMELGETPQGRLDIIDEELFEYVNVSSVDLATASTVDVPIPEVDNVWDINLGFRVGNIGYSGSSQYQVGSGQVDATYNYGSDKLIISNTSGAPISNYYAITKYRKSDVILIAWENLSNMAINQSPGLTGTGGTWGTTGANSITAMTGDGVLSFETNGSHDYMVGLGTDAATNGNSDSAIDYAIYIHSSTIRIRENGTEVHVDAGAAANPGAFKIERVGTTITYYRGDILMYTSLVPSMGNLFIDVAMNGSKVINKIAFEF